MKGFGFMCVVLSLTGCREPKHVVERVEVVGATVTDNPLLGLNPAQVQALWAERLAGDSHFRLLKPGEDAPSRNPTNRMSLELAFTREEQKAERAGTYAEVGATLEIRRKNDEGVTRYDVTGLGEARLTGESLDERQQGIRVALERAIDQSVAAARLQLDALKKPDRELIRDLKAPDSRVSSFALHALAERHNPAAVPALLEALKGSDPDEVRRAMGGLVEIRDARAVPALIDLMRGRDPGFAKEILFALSAIGGDEAQAYLYTVSQGYDQPTVQEAAKQALEELDARQRGRPPQSASAKDGPKGAREP